MKWEQKTFKELGYIARGRSRHRPRNESSLYGGVYPFIQTGDIKAANLHVTEYSQTYNDKGLAQSKLWPKDTLCITIAANIAETALLGMEACFPDSVIGFIADEQVSDVRYIKYFFDIFKDRMKSAAVGAAQDNLSMEKLDSFKVPSPHISVQRRIASILSTYDDLIENNLRRIKLLEDAARCEYRMLMDESEAKIMKLADVCELIMGQSPPSNTYNENGEGLPFHQGVTNFGFRFLRHEIYCSKPVRIAQEGDILMSVRAPVGRLNFASDSICLGRGVSAIRHKLGLQQIQYQALKDFFFVEDRIGNGAIFNSTTKTEMENLELEYPTSQRSEEVELKLQQMHSHMLVLTKQNTQLQRARDILLPKLMSGELEISSQAQDAKIIQMEVPVSMVGEVEVTYASKKANAGSRYYLRTLLAAYIVDKLWQENTFGHVKLMKLMYLCEHLAEVETISNYHRDAAGPYDNQMIRSIDTQLKKKQWFEMYNNKQGYPKYRPLARVESYKSEFDKYYSMKQGGIDSLLALFGKEPTEKAEIAATVYSAWRDLSIKQDLVVEDEVVHEVLNNWHESKKRISEDRWRSCYSWMQKRNWIT